MPPVELTSDTWDIIIDVLGDEPVGPDHTSIRNLALTCSAMVSPCRRQLFKTIHLTNRGPISLLKVGLLHDLITHTPAITRYVRYLEYRIDTGHTDDVRLPQIFELLCSSESLRSFSFWGHRNNWDGLPRPFQIALEKLIQLPTLTRLSLSTMQSVPASIFFRVGSSKITRIFLREVGLTMISGSNAVAVGHARSTIRPISLVAEPDSFGGLQLLMESFGPLSGGAGIFDFSGLRDLEFFDIDSSRRLEFVGRILHISRAVQSLKISTGFNEISWVGLGASLSAEWTAATLTKLTLSLLIASEDADPLRGLIPELARIAGNNGLQELSLDVHFDIESSCRVDTEDWSAFDSLMTRPGSFQRLRAVTVMIAWLAIFDLRDSDDDSDSEEERANQVTERNFTKLLESPDVEFQFSSKVYGGSEA